MAESSWLSVIHPILTNVATELVGNGLLDTVSFWNRCDVIPAFLVDDVGHAAEVESIVVFRLDADWIQVHIAGRFDMNRPLVQSLDILARLCDGQGGHSQSD